MGTHAIYPDRISLQDRQHNSIAKLFIKTFKPNMHVTNIISLRTYSILALLQLIYKVCKQKHEVSLIGAAKLIADTVVFTDSMLVKCS